MMHFEAKVYKRQCAKVAELPYAVVGKLAWKSRDMKFFLVFFVICYLFPDRNVIFNLVK